MLHPLTNLCAISITTNVTAGEKFEMSQSEVVKNLHIEEGPVQDKEQDSSIGKRAVPNHYIYSIM